MSSSDATLDKPEPIATQKVFRWLNFGSCLFRIAFDTAAFHGAGYNGLPLQVNKIWRREISAVMHDWETTETFSRSLAPSPFSEAWLAPKSVFTQSDVILVDLVLDIFQPRGLRFRRAGEQGGTPYDHIVSNFPDEPPEGLEAELGAFDCDEASSLQAWERFGREVKTPVVFVTMENRDDIPRGYTEDFRQKLLQYQDKLAALARQFPHWLVVSLDDIFAEVGKDCYIDRHHPSKLGWEILRSTLPKMILDSGILRADAGGPPLPMRNWNIPERCDFELLDLAHIRALSSLGGPACAIGPTRLTAAVQPAFGAPIDVHGSFSALNGKPSPALIIILKWSQPVDLPTWLAGLIKQHPDSLIEIPSLWRGRENFMFGESEKNLRRDLKAFGAAHKSVAVELGELPLARCRYVARCLLATHRLDPDAPRLVPLAQAGAAAAGAALPAPLVDALATTALVPVFGARS